MTPKEGTEPVSKETLFDKMVIDSANEPYYTQKETEGLMDEWAEIKVKEYAQSLSGKSPTYSNLTAQVDEGQIELWEKAISYYMTEYKSEYSYKTTEEIIKEVLLPRFTIASQSNTPKEEPIGDAVDTFEKWVDGKYYHHTPGFWESEDDEDRNIYTSSDLLKKYEIFKSTLKQNNGQKKI